MSMGSRASGWSSVGGSGSRMLAGLDLELGPGLGGEDLEIELLIDLGELAVGGENAQLGQDGGGHFLGLVDEQRGSAAGGLDVGEPGFAEDLETAPAVVGREDDAEELSHLAVEVAEPALRPGEDADGDVGQRR